MKQAPQGSIQSTKPDRIQVFAQCSQAHGVILGEMQENELSSMVLPNQDMI